MISFFRGFYSLFFHFVGPFSSFRGLASFSFTGSGVVVEPIKDAKPYQKIQSGQFFAGGLPLGFGSDGWMGLSPLGVGCFKIISPDRFEEFHGLKLCDFFFISIWKVTHSKNMYSKHSF